MCRQGEMELGKLGVLALVSNSTRGTGGDLGAEFAPLHTVIAVGIAWSLQTLTTPTSPHALASHSQRPCLLPARRYQVSKTLRVICLTCATVCSRALKRCCRCLQAAGDGGGRRCSHA